MEQAEDWKEAQRKWLTGRRRRSRGTRLLLRASRWLVAHTGTGVASEWCGLLGRTDVLILATKTVKIPPAEHDEITDIAIVNTRGEVVYSAPVMPRGVSVSPNPPIDQSRLWHVPQVAPSDVHDLRLERLAAERWPQHHAAVCKVLGNAKVVLCYEVDSLILLEWTAEMYGLDLPDVEAWCWLKLDHSAHRPLLHRHEGEPRLCSLQQVAYAEGVLPKLRFQRALDDALLALALMRAVALKAEPGHFEGGTVLALLLPLLLILLLGFIGFFVLD